MRLDRSLLLGVALALPISACDLVNPLGTDPNSPSNLSYQLIPSGDPNVPLGVILTWQPPASGRAVTYDIYGRVSTSSDWTLRATTTSPSFHDVYPELQYYIVANDDQGAALGQSPTITVDMHSELPAPAGLHSISLNAAIQLAWSRNALDANRNAFAYYRLYSAAFDAAHSACSSWELEGSTVSEAFLVSGLQNGMTRCYAVSAVSRDGHESAWSAATEDTPRYDARNVLVYARDIHPDSAGFLFYDETAKRYGVVGAATRIDGDFTVERHTDGSLWLNPARSDVLLGTYASVPVPDLTSIDRASGTALTNAALQAMPGFAYVFSTHKTDGVHYAALRVAYVAQNYVVFDWSYQSAMGNVELTRVP